VTQLRVVNVEDPQEDRVVFASTMGDAVPEVRRLVTWPRWSADGRNLLFLWQAPNEPPDGIYMVDVPADLSRLPEQPPQPGYFAATRLSRLNVGAGDFGHANGYIQDYLPRPTGSLLVVYCDSKGPNARCGLGEWDGARARPVLPMPDGPFQVLRPALLAEGIVAAYVFQPNDDRLSAIDLATGAETRLRKLDRGSATPTVPASLPFAPSADGKYVLMETASSPRALTLVPLNNTTGTFWSEGHSPSWYVAGRPAPAGTTMPSTPVTAPPTPGPTPATPAPPGTAPMLVNVTVRRQGNPCRAQASARSSTASSARRVRRLRTASCA
jgi:hypothetical protein